MEKQNRLGYLKVNRIIRFLPMIFSLLAMASLFIFPFAEYQYKRTPYSLRGQSFLWGAKIAGGSVEVLPNTIMWIFVIAMAAVIVCTCIPAGRKFIASEIMTVAGIVGVVSSIYLTSKLSDVLDGVKKVHAGSGTVICIVLCIAVVAVGFYELKEHKIMCSLDFMVLPGLLYFVINNYIPMFGIYIAFKKVDYSKGLWGSDWVGLANFKYLFSTSDAFIITRNTLLYNLTFIVLGIITGIIGGICLAEITNKILSKIYQTSILLPQLISFVIVSYIVYALLSNETGLITKLMGDNAVNFYSETKYWPFILVFINVWKQLGYNAIIFLSSIVGFDHSINEAASVDGASKWQRIWKITLPQLKPTIMTLFLLQVGRIFYSDFGLFYQVPLDAGALYNVTNTIDTYVYRALMVNNNISIASAASTYQAIVGFILVFAVNMIVRKVDKENALF